MMEEYLQIPGPGKNDTTRRNVHQPGDDYARVERDQGKKLFFNNSSSVNPFCKRTPLSESQNKIDNIIYPSNKTETYK
jgi:hypothetical protein